MMEGRDAIKAEQQKESVSAVDAIKESIAEARKNIVDKNAKQNN